MAKVNEDLPGLQSLMADKLPPLPRNKDQKPIYDSHAHETPKDKDLGRGKDADSVDAPRIGGHNVDGSSRSNNMPVAAEGISPRNPANIKMRTSPATRLNPIIETEANMDISKQRLDISVSEDVSFVLHALASHSCPMGLLVSAMVRHYVTNNLPEMEVLLRYNKTDN